MIEISNMSVSTILYKTLKKNILIIPIEKNKKYFKFINRLFIHHLLAKLLVLLLVVFSFS